MNSAKMNSKTHKIITARWVSDGLQHFVVPIDWEIEDIEIGYGLLSYKGEEKPYIPEKFIECADKNTEYIDSIEEADWEDVAGYFSCCESDEEEEEEKPDIVFHCESCKKPIVRDSEDHDFSKCHEEKWYCVDCPCEEEEEEEEEEEKEKQLNAVKTIIKYVYRYVLGYHEEADGYGRCDCGGGYNTQSCFWHYEEYEYACLKCRDLAEEDDRHDICIDCYNRECECEKEEEEEEEE